MAGCGMTVETGYRGLRRTLSRDALLGAAVELIGTRGFAAVAIDDIVARAGVAKGTFYNHFKDKPDIAHHVALGIRHEIRDRIAEVKIISSDPATHLAIALTLFLQLAVSEPHKARMLVTLLTDVSDLGAPMNARVRATLEAGESMERFAIRSLDAALIFVLGIVAGGIKSILERPGMDKAEDLVLCLVSHGLTGLGVRGDEAFEIAQSTIAEFFQRR
jgi:AcrR family transcriptional regulator